jgi:hypothetical protein
MFFKLSVKKSLEKKGKKNMKQRIFAGLITYFLGVDSLAGAAPASNEVVIGSETSYYYENGEKVTRVVRNVFVYDEEFEKKSFDFLKMVLERNLWIA